MVFGERGNHKKCTCFRKAGVLDSTLSVVVHNEQDTLLAVDESVLKLKELFM